MRTIYTLLLTCFAVFSLNAQVLFETDFTDGMPESVTQQTASTDGGWNVGTNGASQYWPLPEGDGNVAYSNDDACNCDKSADYMILPSVSLEGVSSLLMDVSAFFRYELYQGGQSELRIEYSTDEGTTWSVADEFVGADAWTDYTFDLSSIVNDAAGGDVLIALRYNDGGVWSYGAAVDNIVLYQPAGLDLELTAITSELFHLPPATVDIEGVITNKGSETITSFDIVTISTAGTFFTTVSDVNIAPLGTYNFTTDTPLNLEDIGVYDVSITVSNPNGGEDANSDNNSTNAKFSALPFVPENHVVAEEATGTWCGWCPRGAVALDDLTAQYPETFIGIAVHNGDPMVVTEYDAAMAVGGYPSGHVDRVDLDVDPGDFGTYYNTRIGTIAPANLSNEVVWDVETGLLSIDVSAHFAVSLEGDYRLNLVITEDGVTGTTAGYNQANYYSGGGAGAMGGWESLSDPVPAADVVYDHVARAILGGFDGVAGSLPMTIEQDGIYTQKFEYSVPASQNVTNLHVIALLIDNQTGAIMNGMQNSYDDFLFTEIVGIGDNTLENSVKVYPNPAVDVANVELNLEQTQDVRMEVYNALGQQVAARDYGQLSGKVLLPFNANNFDAGLYLFTLYIDGEQVTKRVTLK